VGPAIPHVAKNKQNLVVLVMGKKKQEAARAAISMDTELAKARKLFENIPDPRAGNIVYRLSDIFMSGLAMFSLKYDSLLNFDQQTAMERANLKAVYGVEEVCSDTHLRRILDEQRPDPLRDFFLDRFKDFESTGLLSEYEYKIGMAKYLIVSADGVQHFSSKKIKCDCCLEKKHRDGSTTYHHNMLCAALVHPARREVFVMDSEAIQRQDGAHKNDCELNAAKRLFTRMGSEYRDFSNACPFLIVEDALYANVPHLRHLQNQGYSYIINVKPDSHKTLFKHFESRRQRKQTKIYTMAQDGVQHRFEWINDVPLNNSDGQFRVNYLSYEQTDAKGKKTIFSWVTNINLRRNRVWAVMKAGRSRWKIENETFNTLKNLGYRFEHNYGHGEDHLSVTLAHLMLMAFNIDQFVQACSKLFQEAQKQFRTKVRLWQAIKAVFQTIRCTSMAFIYRYIAGLNEVRLI